MRLPPLEGAPIQVEYRAALRAWRGHLHAGGQRGAEVHAGSFLRRRLIVLDAAIGTEHARILTHELAHFVWLRLGNTRRRSWEDLLARETARGELGWSAEWRRNALAAAARRQRSRKWREYACESFCDTAAWLWSGVVEHDEFTLAQRWRRRRRQWFEALPQRLKA